MISERDNTAEVISQAIQSQSLYVRSAARSTQGLTNGHVETSDPPLKKAKLCKRGFS